MIRETWNMLQRALDRMARIVSGRISAWMIDMWASDLLNFKVLIMASITSSIWHASWSV
jgi:hypothetical protein